jgi:hypothetical protein
MSTNMELITSVTVGSGGAASVTLPASGTIPQTYTDLKILISARDNSAQIGNNILMQINGGTTSQSVRAISGDGSSAPNSYSATPLFAQSNGNSSTAGTFSNIEVYIPNYASTTTNKSVSVDSVTENNGTTALAQLSAGLYASNTAITTISFVANGSPNILEGSTFYLYGISSVTSTPKATGGIVSQDNTYWYHTFPFSSTFTPTAALTNVDYLVIAGGGGGSSTNGNDTRGGGGGGAGGLRSTVSATGGGGTLESKISLNSGTTYAITIGAGGNGGDANTYGTNTTNGGNSSITGTGLTTITSDGGGRAGNVASGNGAVGGSGGGGNLDSGTGASGTANQGYAGSNAVGASGSTFKAGGGGGAGGNATTPTAGGGAGGNGGVGVLIIDISNATFTGANNGYYAGGGGGNSWVGNTAGVGGLGGGGNGTNASMTGIGQNGFANTGGGGGGSGNSSSVNGAKGGNGGSGLVVLRYAK